MATKSDTQMLEAAQALSKAHSDLELANGSVAYYQRVLAAAEARVEEKLVNLGVALSVVRGMGG